MVTIRSANARSFGRREAALALRAAPRDSDPGVADDLRLFALTFAGGFLFMAVYLG